MKYLEVVNQNYHLQGFTTDGEHMYWSFTIRETATLEMEEGKILSFIRPLFDSEMGL